MVHVSAAVVCDVLYKLMETLRSHISKSVVMLSFVFNACILLVLDYLSRNINECLKDGITRYIRLPK